VLNKERATGSYRLSAYFLGKSLAETPLWLVLPILFSCISYWMVGMSSYSGNFFFFILIMCLFVLMGNSIGVMVAAIIPDLKKALTFSVVIVLGSVLLGGFFINRDNLPVWIAWARWLSYMKYAYELILINEFALSHNQTFTPAPTHSAYDTNGGPITGGDVLDHYGVETNWWGDIIFLVGVIVVARVLGYFALRFLNKPRM
jgi:ABC-type multidrug transport system permease subunit